MSAPELILNIESSTGVCSVCISSGSNILSARESREGRSHAALLTVFIDEVMKEADLEFRNLSAVAVSRGPGSYTGLRIGISAAKGICYAADLKLIAVNTLAVMTEMVISSALSFPGGEIMYCPMIDARRMEVYTALFDSKGMQSGDISAEIITEDTFRVLLNEKKVIFFGDGAEKCRDIINHSKALFIPGIYPSARMMAELSGAALKEGRFEDPAYFIPFYLKDFIATTPKNKML
jgi:tRNA threonylcarbamoyladenosine biosynthesis protein TsaB